jgi:hypothetical protein
MFENAEGEVEELPHDGAADCQIMELSALQYCDPRLEWLTPTPSAKRPAPSAKRPAPSAERPAPSAKRQTPKRRAILRCGLRCSQCREMHDFFFRCVVPGKLARQSAVPHNEDPIC